MEVIMDDWLPGVLTALLTVFGTYLVARLGSRATHAKTVADHDVSAGELALRIAQESNDQVRALRQQNANLLAAWRDLRSYVDRVVERLSPEVRAEVGEPPKPPNLEL